MVNTRHMSIAAMIVLVGCGAKQQPEPAEPQVAINLTEQGLQPFPSGEVDAESLQATFAGYTVVSDDGQHFAVRDGGNTVLHVQKSGDNVMVKVTSAEIPGPAGIHVGAPWSKVNELTAMQCQRGAAPWTAQAFCTSGTLPGIMFGFDISGVITPGCTESCAIEDLSAMDGTVVRFIDWQP